METSKPNISVEAKEIIESGGVISYYRIVVGYNLKIFFNEMLMLYIPDTRKVDFLYSNNLSSNCWEIVFIISGKEVIIKLGTNERFFAIIPILNTYLKNTL